MNKIDISLWLLIEYEDNTKRIEKHICRYEYLNNEMTELFFTKYKNFPINLLLDKNYKSNFKFIDYTENLRNINYEVIDCGINYMKLNGDIIYKGKCYENNK